MGRIKICFPVTVTTNSRHVSKYAQHTDAWYTTWKQHLSETDFNRNSLVM